MGDYCRDLMSLIDHMGTGEWLFVSAVGLAIGIFWLRGLGSRSSY
jgi:hypothetical protein